MANHPATVAIVFNERAAHEDVSKFMNTLIRSVDSVTQISWGNHAGSVETRDGFEVHRYICDNDPQGIVKSSQAHFKS